VAIAAKEAYHFLGSPEGELAIAQAVVYLATAPKSNSLYQAEKSIAQTLNQHPSLPVPMHLRNAPTELMKAQGYSDGYLYPHDDPEGVVDQQYLPGELTNRKFYHPKDFGFEREIQKRLAWWTKKRQKSNDDPPVNEG